MDGTFDEAVVAVLMRWVEMKGATARSNAMKRLIATGLMVLCLAVNGHAARLKDIADVEGVRPNQLLGYGLVVGLNGTGDGKSVEFTIKGISNMLEKMGVRVPATKITVKNVAAVTVTASLPPFAKAGTKIDVTLSSLGDAKSLQGGTLIFTPLKGADGNVYAVAQGAVSVGGFAVEGGGDTAQKNHPTVGVIALGATVERAIPFDLFQSKKIRIVLREPDFTTMTRAVSRINSTLGRPFAVAVDGSSVEVPLEAEYAKNPIALVALLENVDVDIDAPAKVVVNERTGTIIMGEHVRVGKVALAHGNLNIAIRQETEVSQPMPFAQGETAIINNTDLTVGEEGGSLQVVGGEVTLGDLVSALNALGATPRDLVSIFTVLKRAGALYADLEIM